jgi:hypothetical protein
MRSYHFSLRNGAGDNENLGYLAMADDEEALSFGRSVIRDIMSEHAASYADSVIEITEGDRAVRSVALGSEASQRQDKFGRV